LVARYAEESYYSYGSGFSFDTGVGLRTVLGTAFCLQHCIDTFNASLTNNASELVLPHQADNSATAAVLLLRIPSWLRAFAPAGNFGDGEEYAVNVAPAGSGR
jgi:hypothetical protein